MRCIVYTPHPSLGEINSRGQSGVRIFVGLLGKVSATCPHALPAGKIVGQPITIALRCVYGIGLGSLSLSTRYNAAVGDSLRLLYDIENLRSDRNGNSMLTRAIIHYVSGTLTSCWNAVNNSDAVFMICWILMTFVTNADISIEKRKFEGFVLSALEYTIRWFETVE